MHFVPLILRLELSHNAIENEVYYDLATTLHYFLNKKREHIDRPEVIDVAKGVRPPIEMPSKIKVMTKKPIVCSISVSFWIFVYNSNKQ